MCFSAFFFCSFQFHVLCYQHSSSCTRLPKTGSWDSDRYRPGDDVFVRGSLHNGKVEIIANDQGNRITPSWVAFTDTEHLIGEAAKNQAALNPEHTVFDVKRLIGRKFDDPAVQRDMKMLPYQVVDKDGKPYVQVKTKDGEVKVFSPEEVSAMVLRKMKETAESYLGKKVHDAVVTVPAYFNDAQRQATKDAGAIAGLNVVRIINEPTAAAIAYGLDKEGVEKNILVFDLGGGTFDVSILSMDNGVFEVLATNGDTHLGGEDFDHRLMDYFVKLIKKKHNKDISQDKKALGKLRKECDRAKRALSSQHQVRVEIESLFDGKDFSESLTRARFEELNMDLFRKTMEPVKKALKDAKLKVSDIHEIVLVGAALGFQRCNSCLRSISVGRNRTRVSIPMRPSPTELPYKGESSVGKKPKVYQGERAMAKDCHELGQFELSGIPPAQGRRKRHTTRDSRRQGCQRSKSITITNDNGRLSEEEIRSKVLEAEEFAEEDRKVRERVETRNKLETYVFNMKSAINDDDKLANKIEADDKKKTENAVRDAVEWLERMRKRRRTNWRRR
ncbi:UNVERIFIED_CONTAM: Heat shock protein BIP1 [Sesamum radiatum]|uniref:Heat shock protein BIP1 n=1 Tax=Sesamum radiatum TaxID=300843 RepID=A0AAW2UBR3_SESRA